ncbi:MAG: c-type cytochrome [Myxococcales bacterium]|nr:c-type cytochrome [Polyangiaceae bacterium]MDW8249177.1 c-type cytochrome [Myxococcales bacterium]
MPSSLLLPRKVLLATFALAPAALALTLGCKGPHGGAPAGNRSISAQAPPLPPDASPQVIAGAASYQKYCALCHGIDARGYAADNAPSLVSPTFLESASDHFLTRSIREGRQGTAMAGYAKPFGGPLDDRQIGEIIAYLRSQGPAPLQLPPHRSSGNAARGQEVYDRSCVPCHGTQAQRGFAVQIWHPNFLAAASDEFLHHAITLGRPGTAMPAFIGTLSPGEIDDLLALLKSWGGASLPRPAIQPLEIPKGPVVINPGGAMPKFTLRENRYVPAEQVKKALDAKNRLVIIDARATSDWHQAHIPGAISVPYYGFSRLDDVPNDDKTWVLAYCACPHHASGVVVDELRRRGYKHTAIIDEGILEWQRRKYPIEGEPLPAASGSTPKVPPRLAPLLPHP